MKHQIFLPCIIIIFLVKSDGWRLDKFARFPRVGRFCRADYKRDDQIQNFPHLTCPGNTLCGFNWDIYQLSYFTSNSLSIWNGQVYMLTKNCINVEIAVKGNLVSQKGRKNELYGLDFYVWFFEIKFWKNRSGFLFYMSFFANFFWNLE